MRYLDLFAAAALLLAAGCVSYEYKGESAGDPSASVAVFMNATRIRRTYQVLGEATVSGDCRDVSRDRLMNKLISEAEKNGADAVLVGRPFATMMYGAGGEGVKVLLDKLVGELKGTMTMCGAASLKDISRDMIRI